MSVEEIEVATEPVPDLTTRTIMAMMHEISRAKESVANISKLFDVLADENGVQPVTE